jgi:hypothetical protein
VSCVYISLSEAQRRDLVCTQDFERLAGEGWLNDIGQAEVVRPALAVQAGPDPLPGWVLGTFILEGMSTQCQAADLRLEAGGRPLSCGLLLPLSPRETWMVALPTYLCLDKEFA